MTNQQQSKFIKLFMPSKNCNTTWWINTVFLILGFVTYLISGNFSEKSKPPTVGGVAGYLTYVFVWIALIGALCRNNHKGLAYFFVYAPMIIGVALIILIIFAVEKIAHNRPTQHNIT